MGKWEREGDRYSAYRQTVEDGFILTQGDSSSFGFDGNPFDIRPEVKLLQLLKVHPKHPMEIGYGGRISIRPLGDKRLIGEILRDPNQKLYDSVSFFLVPYEVQLETDFPGETFRFRGGFVNLKGDKNPASLVYYNGRQISIDGEGSRTVASIIPPQIPHFLHGWLYHAGRVLGYDEKAPFREGWKDMGRFELESNGLPSLVLRITKKLEERFETRIRVERDD